MGKLADAIRGVALPGQKQTQLLRLDVQYEELESQLASFKEQNAALYSENQELKNKNKLLKEEVEKLKNRKIGSSHASDLDPDAEKILVVLSNAEALGAADIQRELDLSHPRIEYFLRVLWEGGYIRPADTEPFEGKILWGLDHAGNEFLVMKGHA